MSPATSSSPSPRIELPSPLEHRWQALRLFEARVRERLEVALEPHDLTYSEYAALAALHYSDDGGHLRQQFLAESIPINQSSLSRMVDRLERNGLTERYHCADDRRGVYTQITEQGRAKVAEARESYLAALREALAEEPDDGVRAGIVALLNG
ncbi:DNA-binding MarR family transcriptional regulator [Haloactinospora alba]|uniref:DNA-binding MarR family transcriptional regulator n=1 Tax=Haloactinospora alba TaxID=405555 RepID=A0A543NN70_9ACTN|nr:MarR family transcriptional regulator [Haloactinospora alba]TQN33275.1 DNA-binding MarR family transcriptional regulator [Haloactinospora alba]